MKAAIYESFSGTIAVQDVPVPKISESGVLIQVMATGVCRSDWHGWKGHDGDVKKCGLPFCPGHEFSGVVVSVGTGVKRFGPGDRVAIPFILSCGSCHHCSAGHPTVCARQEQPGFTQWGSFAEYVAIPRADRNLSHLPPNVSFVQAAALGCRFTTAYRAVVQQGKLKRGHTVAVFGCGGLGLSCIMMAASQGAKSIIAVDVSVAALEKAKTLGATHTVLTNKTQDSQAVAIETCQHTAFQEGTDLTIDAAGFHATSEAAVYATRPGGRMVQAGLPFGPPKIPMSLVAGREIEIVGSHGFDAKDLPDLLQLVAEDSAMDPSLLVERCVSLEEGCEALMEMDRSSPLGMTMITKFSSVQSRL
jgi:alcohol dehydrogenase